MADRRNTDDGDRFRVRPGAPKVLKQAGKAGPGSWDGSAAWDGDLPGKPNRIGFCEMFCIGNKGVTRR